MSDRTQFPTWTKHWSQLGWDRAMKEATVPCSRTAENVSAPSLGFVGDVRGSTVLLEGEIFLFEVLFHITQGKGQNVIDVHPVSQKSDKIPKLLILQPKPWQMLASGGDKRLTCLKECPLSVRPALCHFVIFFVDSTVNIFRLKKRFHPSACQI